jgi:hypothetical protein
MKDGKTLNIVGNGFDLYHQLTTSYQEFAFYLQKNQEELHRLLHQYIGLPWLEEDNHEDHWNQDWSNFERNLAGLDIEYVLDDHSDLAANPSAEDFRSRDWHHYEHEMQRIVELLTDSLNIEFRSFINAVHIPNVPEVQLLELERSTKYLSFNYTNTLERVYRINHERINYIHGKANDEYSEIILGHGFDPNAFQAPKIDPPDHLDPEEIEDWYRNGEDGYEYSRDQAENEVMTYFFRSHKSVDEIIDQNLGFFKSLSDTEVICVIGHSVSDVDLPYFEKVFEIIEEGVKWVVTYYSKEGMNSTYENLLSIGIEPGNIKMVKMDFFFPEQPSLFDF